MDDAPAVNANADAVMRIPWIAPVTRFPDSPFRRTEDPFAQKHETIAIIESDVLETIMRRERTLSENAGIDRVPGPTPADRYDGNALYCPGAITKDEKDGPERNDEKYEYECE
jgi:hypothetical protein